MDSYEDFDPAQRAARGAKLLDEKRSGWAKEIDIDMLNMASCYWCIMGQLFGGYGEGRDLLDLEAGHFFGFDLPYAFKDADRWRLYGRLRHAWISEIQRRTEVKEDVPCLVRS